MKPGFLKQILTITLFRLLLNTSRRFVYPFAPALSRSLDVPLAAVTSIIAAGQFTSLLGIFAGPVVDRLGCYREGHVDMNRRVESGDPSVGCVARFGAGAF